MFSKLRTIIGAGTIAALIYTFRPEIKQVISGIGSCIYSQAIARLNISSRCGRSNRAIHSYLMDKDLIKSSVDIMDIPNGSRYQAADGHYLCYDETCGYIDIELAGGNIIIHGFKLTGGNLKNLHSWLNGLIAKYCSIKDNLTYFSLDESNGTVDWSFCTIRPLISLAIPESDGIQTFTCSVDNFMRGRSKYEKQNIPYRRGYLLHGQKGTYKTMMVKYVASKYKRPIYNLSLSCRYLNDNSLESLVAKLPNNTILLLDELDQMLDRPSTLDNSVTSAGILKALAGPIDLPDGTIVIITTNFRDKLNQMIPALCRDGRIDETIEFSPIESSPVERFIDPA